MKNIRSRKGVTIIEVVIALAIITIISAATLSLIVMSEGVETKAENAFIVKNSAENAIECFRFAKNYALELSAGTEISMAESLPKLFASYLRKTGYVIGTMTDGVFTESQLELKKEISVDTNSVFRMIKGGCVILIEQTTDGFAYTARNAKGEEIYSFTYPEGGASQ
jgi:prepilin-type N-terminal cleavage/methylation domain-containing protein